MNICLVARMFDISKNAGLGRMATEVQDRLIQRGYNVHSIESNSVELAGYFKHVMWDIPRYLPQADVYIALTPMESIWLPKNKTIAIVNDLIPLLYPNLAGHRMNDNLFNRTVSQKMFWLGAKQASQCAKIVAISEMVKDDVQRVFKVPDSKITVLKPGIREDLEPGPKPDNIFRIGYLGQLDRRKRVNLLIDAFKETDIDGELVIAGSGIDADSLKQQAKGDSRIRFLGFIPDDQIRAFYNSLDLFCFPTAVEGLGLPILEAMACRRPVLTLQDAIIPKDVSRWAYQSINSAFTQMLWNLYYSWLKSHWLTEGPSKTNAAHLIAKRYTWVGFMDGLEKLIKEVANV